MQTVTPGAAELQVTPMAWQIRAGAAVHFDTGLSWVDVDDDFSRARRRQVLARLAGWLRRRPDANRILSFDEVVAALGWRGEHHLGLQTIQLDTVAGTVDSWRDFDRRFRPTSNRVRQRWEQLDLAARRGVAIRRSTSTASAACTSSRTATTASRSPEPPGRRRSRRT